MKKAFTLAETLITLAVIGIIAAMTLPSLIQKHNNRVVETRLMKFYSVINQAVLMAEIDYGDKKIWYEDICVASTAQRDSDGNVTYDTSEIEEWCKKYLLPYMNVLKTESTSNGDFVIYFADGSALSQGYNTSRDWLFYPGHIDECLKLCGQTGESCNGRCRFSFNFNPASTSSAWKYHYDKGFEPFKYSWDGNVRKLYSNNMYGCNDTAAVAPHYCTAIIQMNGWKIPDDYPFKVRY